MNESLRKIYWLLSVQFGLDLRRLARSLRAIPRYLSGFRQFRARYHGSLSLCPCLYDWYEEGGSTRDEYFSQDLYVARKIFSAKPQTHVDIGSRIDGFVAHVASFRNIEVFDIRPISATIPGVSFRQADLSNPAQLLTHYCDSLSCLHALEHFGLGRYGDPINALAYVDGLRNMARLLRPGGTFYLSVPLGKARVEFNAHRIFDPFDLLKLATDEGLVLTELATLGQDRILRQSAATELDLAQLQQKSYTLGIFTFTKA